jgi:hypothetical protein
MLCHNEGHYSARRVSEIVPPLFVLTSEIFILRDPDRHLNTLVSLREHSISLTQSLQARGDIRIMFRVKISKIKRHKFAQEPIAMWKAEHSPRSGRICVLFCGASHSPVHRSGTDSHPSIRSCNICVCIMYGMITRESEGARYKTRRLTIPFRNGKRITIRCVVATKFMSNTFSLGLRQN